MPSFGLSCLICLLFAIYRTGLADIFAPYKVGQHGPTHNNAFIKACQPVHYGNLTHETHKADQTESASGVHKLEYFSTSVGADKHHVSGHLVIVNNPNKWMTLMEPGGPGGCQEKKRVSILQSSKTYHCEAAINAGFYNTHTGQCLGNVVVNGRVVRDSNGIQNAHFGITRAGELFFGFLSEQEVLASTFTTLVGGVVWLVRRGRNYVSVSAKSECSKTEETGAMKRFINVRSARTAVGHDLAGRLVLAHVDGKTDVNGVNLFEFADLLLSFGVVNAINFDGGGSSTMVVNQTLVNYPSDVDPLNNMLRVIRPVSTGLCVQSPACSRRGPNACAGLCLHNGTCDFGTGRCICPPGYRGVLCERRCPVGFWGKNCRRLCTCDEEACGRCDHVTGACNVTACCDAKRSKGVWKRYTGQDTTWLAVLIALAVTSSLSIIVNISLLCSRCKNDTPRYHLLEQSPRSSPMRSMRFLNAIDENEAELSVLPTVQSSDTG